MTKSDSIYAMALLEEIRHLLAENLLIQARIYDRLRQPDVALEDVEEPTYNLAEEITEKSEQTLNKLQADLGGKP